jgi:hypothetical protein
VHVIQSVLGNGQDRASISSEMQSVYTLKSVENDQYKPADFMMITPQLVCTCEVARFLPPWFLRFVPSPVPSRGRVQTTPNRALCCRLRAAPYAPA